MTPILFTVALACMLQIAQSVAASTMANVFVGLGDSNRLRDRVCRTDRVGFRPMTC
ncbi:hypothetical protein O4H53_06300 [Sulfitobacter sp. G21635-S1]|uniref:hypothetical protein n=1 Tax=Sulfitobacter sp. G21635-S1 TaxID=3014043 RepID=UPI0022AE69D1|nr:hypothetical protein [Sulfitobacter sp. G21635-S1]MCZ4255141.1 hypothetical protein [Sulfitobacter sp. G21635-S1]